MNVEILSASAGTGKTWRLSRDLARALLEGAARPEGVVAITYTTRAAAELESRIRGALLEAGRHDLAARVRDGYLGTIHSVCQRLLGEFALEAGLSPYLEPIPDSERRHLFDRALSLVLAGEESRLNDLARRLSIEDWKEALRRIVEQARENGMDGAALERSAAESRRTLDAFLPPVAVGAADYESRFRREVRRLWPAIREEAAADRDNGAARRRERAASGLVAALGRPGLPPWKDQAQAASLLDLRKLERAAGAFVGLVRDCAASEGFQADLHDAQARLFALAARALHAFASEKTASRVVDFGDMLALARQLLETPGAAEALRARLDIVVVDEFQDTSPLQLAVAAALGRLARRSIWVGDRKQAIFAFQGSDPELMSAAIDVALRGRPPEILSRSYRSRPPLVDMVSELFSRSFAPHGFPEEQVRLVPEHPDPPSLARQPAFETWRWAPEERERDGAPIKASEPDAVAAGVAELLASPPLVRERVAGGPDRLRPACRRDVAVLAFTNDRCRAIAAALRARGVPATVALSGLTFEPEFLLARAALSLLADPADGVAAMEVSWLGGGGAGDPDAWLARRLVEVADWARAREAADRAGERGPARPLAFASDPRVAALRAARAPHLSPAEALDLALRAAGIPELLRAWPDPARRLANLEAVRAEARAYEDLCRARRTGGTALGLVAHLGELGDDAAQATPAAEDAVDVTTWHGAKGLEWPVVVLSQLDHEREPDAFETAVEPAPGFDLTSPLAGRWVRHWPWPYGKLSRGLALLDAAQRSPEAERARERHRRERLRILYVGFTRARDLLVAVARVDPRRGPAAAALRALGEERGKPRIGLPFGEAQGVAAVRVGRRTWPCRVRSLSGLPPTPPPDAAAGVRWTAAGKRRSRAPERLSPSSEPGPAARLVAVTPLRGRPELSAPSEDMGRLGDAVHAFLAADRGGGAEARRAVATRLLAAHGVAGAIDAGALLEASDAFHSWLEARHPGGAWRREWPIRARLDGPDPRLVVGEVDLLLDLADGFVLVDHKSYPGGEAERDRRIAEEWGPQLGWYAAVLSRAFSKPLRAAYVHLPIRGEVAEVELPPT